MNSERTCEERDTLRARLCGGRLLAGGGARSPWRNLKDPAVPHMEIMEQIREREETI